MTPTPTLPKQAIEGLQAESSPLAKLAEKTELSKGTDVSLDKLNNLESKRPSDTLSDKNNVERTQSDHETQDELSESSANKNFNPDESLDKIANAQFDQAGQDNDVKNEGLSNEQKKEIKERTGWSDKIVDHIRSMDEAEIYIKAGLVEGEINGKPALLQPNIDGNAHNEPKWPEWSNKSLAEEGYPPRDSNGRYYELHHIGQNPDSPLAELTYEQHHSEGNFKTLHSFDESQIDRSEFNKERKEYWMARSETL